MSKSSDRQPRISMSGHINSVPRIALALLLVIIGIAWIVVYYNVARLDPTVVNTSPSNPIPFMRDLKRWNYLIGFGLFFLGLTVSAHERTPLGRGRGVVIGMLGCFLIGLIYIITFYFLGNHIFEVPVMDDLNQLNLLVGVAFMAVGFTFATRWE